MTIASGEAVRLLPIVQNGWHFQAQWGFPNGEKPVLLKGGSACYNTSYWTPFCLPIRAKYNDYGSIDSISDTTIQDKAETEQFLSAFKKHAIPLTVGENDCHDVALQEFTMENILRALHEGRVYTKFENVYLTVSWMMIKESVWQSLLAIDIYKTDEGDFYKNYRKEMSLDGIREKIKTDIKLTVDYSALEEKMNEVRKSGYTDEYDDIKTALALMRSNGYAHFARLDTWSYAEARFSPKLVPELADVIVEMEFINLTLGLLRINYAPTGGAGSQTPNQATWQMAFDAWTKIAHADEHQYDE